MGELVHLIYYIKLILKCHLDLVGAVVGREEGSMDEYVGKVEGEMEQEGKGRRGRERGNET